jgi:amidase
VNANRGQARIFLSDGGKSIKKLLDPVGEPLRPEMAGYGTAKDIGVHEMWQIHRERVDICKHYLERWKAAKIDILLCVLPRNLLICTFLLTTWSGPTTPHSTCPHGSYWYVGYTSMFNLLDYSAVSFPTGLHVDKSVDGPYPEQIKPLNEVDRQIRDTCKSRWP